MDTWSADVADAAVGFDCCEGVVGYFCRCQGCALKKVDFPVLGFPTTPSKREYDLCMCFVPLYCCFCSAIFLALATGEFRNAAKRRTTQKNADKSI